MARRRVLVGVGVVFVIVFGFGLFVVATNGAGDAGSDTAMTPASVPPSVLPPVEVDVCATATTSYGGCVGPLTGGAIVAKPRFVVDVVEPEPEPEPVLVEEVVVAPAATTPPTTTWMEQCLQDYVCAGTQPNQPLQQAALDPTPPQASSVTYSGEGIPGIDVRHAPVDVVVIP